MFIVLSKCALLNSHFTVLRLACSSLIIPEDDKNFSFFFFFCRLHHQVLSMSCKGLIILGLSYLFKESYMGCKSWSWFYQIGFKFVYVRFDWAHIIEQSSNAHTFSMKMQWLDSKARFDWSPSESAMGHKKHYFRLVFEFTTLTTHFYQQTRSV